MRLKKMRCKLGQYNGDYIYLLEKDEFYVIVRVEDNGKLVANRVKKDLNLKADYLSWKIRDKGCPYFIEMPRTYISISLRRNYGSHKVFGIMSMKVTGRRLFMQLFDVSKLASKNYKTLAENMAVPLQRVMHPSVINPFIVTDPIVTSTYKVIHT